MENSREEAIERLEKGINDTWFSTTYSQEQEEKDLKILLSDYKRVLKENEDLNNRCKNLDEEAQAYVEELMGDSTLKDRIINRLNKENEELKEKEVQESLAFEKFLIAKDSKDLIKELNNHTDKVWVDYITKRNNRRYERNAIKQRRL